MRIKLLAPWALLLTLGDAVAATQPVEATLKTWELGLGLGTVAGPDYRGSDEYRSFVSPIPYIIYRGKYISSDREGVKGNFLRTENYEFTLSASASITPEAEESRLRQHMPELGSTLELGPSFNINLSGASFAEGWQLQLPLRAVFALTDGKLEYIGSVLHPQLVYRQTYGAWALGYRGGISYASNDYHDYYYNIAPQYVTETRHQFEAEGGYSGWNTQLAMARTINVRDINLRLAFFIRYDNLSGAKFTASPLVVTDNSIRGGAALIWVIK